MNSRFQPSGILHRQHSTFDGHSSNATAHRASTQHRRCLASAAQHRHGHMDAVDVQHQDDGQCATLWADLDTHLRHPGHWTYQSELERTKPRRFALEESWRQKSRKQTVSDLPPAPHVVRRLPRDLAPELLSNAVLLVDKPHGWGTEEVANAVQWACKARRLAHAGTLDCLSTGVVVLLLGDAVRYTSAINTLPREFSGVLRLGLATDTRDAAGCGIDAQPWRHVTDADIEAAAAAFLGERMVVAPPKSAARLDHGRPTYSDATPDLTPRPAYIQQFSAWREPGSKDVRFTLSTTSSGSIVRSIAHDFGRALGTCAHVSQMRREAVGWLRADDAWTLDALLPVMRKTRALAARRR